jgi:FAD:protein FMN transferase
MKPLFRRAQPLLGTLVDIAVPAAFAAATSAAFEAVRHVHARMSFHAEGSDLDIMHCAPVGSVVRIDAGTVHVLRAALALYRQSAGVFDITIAPQLMRSGFLPYRYNIHLDTLDGTSADIDIISDTEVVCHKRVLMDLGGIAKGFAVDQAVAALQEQAVPYGIVNAGGDVRVFGNVPQDVYIRHPAGGVQAVVCLQNEAMAVSCNVSERRGGHTRHIGRRGLCVRSDKSFAIKAPTCMMADALTKIAMADETLAARLLRGSQCALMTFAPMMQGAAA